MMQKCKWVLLTGVFLSYFISKYLPAAWGQENNFLEWLQVVILTSGVFFNYTWWQKARSAQKFSYAHFLVWAIPLWLLIIGRELSWGRVFYPIGYDAVNGPEFSDLEQLPYGRFVHPLLTIIIVGWLYVVIKDGLYKIPYKLLKEHQFPTTDMIITVFAFVVADIGEHKLHIQNMEEFDECLAYIGLILVAYQVQEALGKEAGNLIGEVWDDSRKVPGKTKDDMHIQN